MKTIIINGSPKANGDTAAMIQSLTNHLQGDVRVISVKDRIRPCTDCRRCWQQSGCAIQDDMTALYPELLSCDNLVIASPVWFSSLSGPLLNIASRLQTFFTARRFRHEDIPLRPKKGVILLCGGQKGYEKAAVQSAEVILKMMRAQTVACICSMDTDCLPAAQDTQAMEEIRHAAQLLNTP